MAPAPDASPEADDGLVGAPGGLETAVDAVIAAVEGPDGGQRGLSGIGDEQLLESMRRLERVRNRLPVLDHALVEEVTERALPQRHCRSGTRRLLTGLLRLSPGEAARRVRAAEACRSRTTTTGEPLPATRPALAAAQHRGETSPEQTDIILTALGEVDHRGFDPVDVTAAEELLTRFSTQFAPTDLRRLARHAVETIDPDGTRPTDDVVSDRRHCTLRQGRDGLWRGELRLTPAAGIKLHTVLAPLAQNRTAHLPGTDGALSSDRAATGSTAPDSTAPDGRDGDTTVLGDERSYPQRLHDALEEACDLLLRGDQLPASGGIPATVVLTVGAEQLAPGVTTEPGLKSGAQQTGTQQTGTGRPGGSRGGTVTTADGHVLAAADLAHLAGEAELCTVTTTPAGAPLTLGRTRRIATPSQTLALVARDAGCSFPACDRPPRWCERHHIVPWTEGGTTDLDNLTLLCSYHHRHHLDRGWSVGLDHRRLPVWTPPAWIDPARRPRTNHRVLARLVVEPTTRPARLVVRPPRRPVASAGRPTVPPARTRTPEPVGRSGSSGSVTPAASGPVGGLQDRVRARGWSRPHGTTTAPPVRTRAAEPVRGSVPGRLLDQGWWAELHPPDEDDPGAHRTLGPPPHPPAPWLTGPVPEPSWEPDWAAAG